MKKQVKSEIGDLELYVVRNSEGKFFRTKGYGGYGDTWIESIAKARIYAKLGTARAIVSFFANNYPKYPAPVIVKMKVMESEVLDEKERLQKAKEKKQKAEETREIRNKKWELDRAKIVFEEAEKRYKKLQDTKKN